MPVKVRYSDELYHHGILGQKWGVRRFQNPDGTLTPAGKERYRIDDANAKYSQVAKETQKCKDVFFHDHLRFGDSIINAKYEPTDQNILSMIAANKARVRTAKLAIENDAKRAKLLYETRKEIGSKNFKPKRVVKGYSNKEAKAISKANYEEILSDLDINDPSIKEQIDQIKETMAYAKDNNINTQKLIDFFDDGLNSAIRKVNTTLYTVENGNEVLVSPTGGVYVKRGENSK